MRVLLVNELGGGLGHLVPLMAVAAALGPAWERRFIVPDPLRAKVLVAEHLGREVAVDRSPSWLPAASPAVGHPLSTYAFADALHAMGMGNPEAWRRAMRFWSDLFETARPDLVVTDAAPGVRLAAAGRVPVIAIGNGYSVPPPTRLLPSLVSEKPDVPPATRQREALVLAAANEIQGERGGPTLDHVADLFNGDATFVGTHAALDPYRAYRTGSTWWPCAVPLPRVRPTGTDARSSIFAYLHDSHPALEVVLSLLAAIGRCGSVSDVGRAAKLTPHVYVLHGDPRRIAQRCGAGVTVHDRFVDMADLLSRTSVLIHHGGTGMSHEALASGAPQLLLPINLEQVLTSRSLLSLGVGFIIPPQSGARASNLYEAQIGDGIDRLLRADVQAEALRRASEMKASDFGDTLAAVVATCRQLVGAPSR